MANLIAVLTVAAAIIGAVQAAECPVNARLCGHEIIDDHQCTCLQLLM